MTGPRVDPREIEEERARIQRIREDLATLKRNGAPKEVVEYYLSKERIGVPDGSSEDGRDIGSALRSIAQGVTFNVGDELEAAARSLLPGRTYAGEKEKIDQELHAFRAANPAKALALELGGGLLSGGAVAKLAGAGVKGARALARLAGSGAISGAVAGAGAGEDTEGRLEGAVGGGLAGSVLGAFLSRAIPAAERTKVGQSVADVLSKDVPVRPREVMEKARAALGEAAPSSSLAPSDATVAVAKRLVSRGKVDPAEVQARAAEFADVPEARILDVVGPEGQRHARGIRVLGGEGGEKINAALNAGAAAQRGSVEAALTQDQGRTNVVRLAQELIEAQKKNAAPFYERMAGGGPIDDEVITEILSRPDFQQMVDRHAKLELQAGRKPPKVYAGLDEAAPKGKEKFAPTMEGLDFLKKTLDAEIENAFSSPYTKDYARGHALSAARSQLLARLDELGAGGNPHAEAYRQGRAIWGGDMASRTALSDGAAIMRKSGRFRDPDSIAGRVAEMGAGELELARKGASREVLQYLDGAADNADLTKRISNPDFRERVTALWQEDAPKILDRLSRLRTKAEIRSFIQGGSQTADKIADAAESAGEGFIDSLLSGQGIGKSAIKYSRDKVVTPTRARFGQSERSAQADIYNALIKGDPGERSVLGELLREMERRRLLQTPSAAGQLLGGRLAGAIQGQ